MRGNAAVREGRRRRGLLTPRRLWARPARRAPSARVVSWDSPAPRLWTLAEGLGVVPLSSALASLDHFTPEAAVAFQASGWCPKSSCVAADQERWPELDPGAPGLFLPSLPVLTSALGPAPCLGGTSLFHFPRSVWFSRDQCGPDPLVLSTDPLACWPGGQSFSTEVAKAVTPLTLALRRAGSLVAQSVKRLRTSRRSRFNPWVEEMATHSSTLAWEIPWQAPTYRSTWGSKEADTTERLHSLTHSGSIPEKILWSRKWQLTPVFLPGKPHGQGSLVGSSP